MDRRRQKVTYRPGKAAGVFGLIFGAIFVVIGIVVAIPNFGAFGILWTLAAAVITAYNAYYAFGGKYAGPEIHIESEEDEEQARGDVKERLRQLEDLYNSDLVSYDEYVAKRQEIISQL